ncbi:MAG TPA: cytochrome c3 family protein [Alphaproteobacteria bacterium]|nr:cytochrome c3 family protein [Alphaproteobacteria bacterium]
MTRSLGWLVLLLGATGVALAAPQNSCLDCHSAMDAPLQVTPEKFAQDIHSQKGLNCASCHGGDPTKDDQDESMSKAAGFKGKIKRSDIPALCGKCHSDVAYMRQHNPKLRTDQLSQYKTSVHGQLLAKGDTNVAVCVDCHSVHDLRPSSDPRSTIHPLNVAKTCARCHADPTHMKPYKIPTDQFEKYSKSVHHEALVVRGDLSAPNCTTCHGNHGAAPPGVNTVQNVCATCHVFQAQLFESSPHKDAFKSASLPGCITCHSNHGIMHTSDAMLGTGKKSVCLDCHSEGDAGYKAAAEMEQQIRQLDTAVKSADALITVAEDSGMEVSEARTEQDQARDSLTKARVSIHSLSVSHVNQDIQAGLKTNAKAEQAGKAALAERDFRRKGLGLSLIAILIMLLGLGLYIKQIEK